VEGVGARVVAGGAGAVLRAASDPRLHAVAKAVAGAVEGTGAVFRAELGAGEADAASSPVGAVVAAGGGLVAREAARSEAGAARPWAPEGTELEQALEHGRFVLLTRSQHDGQGRASPVSLAVDLGPEPARTAPEGLGFWRPPWAPAACWCARMTGPSTQATLQATSPAASAARWTAAKRRSPIPASRQRRKRLYTVDHGPYRSGRSRQGAPVRSRHRIPFVKLRLEVHHPFTTLRN